MFRSRPEDVEDSACSRISSVCSITQAEKSRASRADGKPNAGARCMASSITVTVTPPASRVRRMPRP